MRAASTWKALVAALLLSLAMPAFAIYKCESNGKTIYRNLPCAGGQKLDLDDVSGADAGGPARLARERAEVKRLESARHKREAQEEKQRAKAARVYAAKQKKCATLARRAKWAEEDAETAGMKAKERARRKARRAEESYRTTCG